jgi:hypothetical protein
MDEGMLDGKAAMARFCNLISSEPDIAKVGKIKSHKEVTKYCSRNQGFFFNSLLVDGRIRIRTNKLRIRMRIQEAQKHTDPDP